MNTGNSFDQSAILDLIRKISRIIRCEMIKTSQSYGYTPAQLMILKFVFENQPVTLSEISKEIGLSNSTTSGIIDRLVNQGMLERKRSEQDRRVVYITPTQKAKELRDKIHSYKEQFFQNLTARLSDEDKIQMVTSLQKLYSLLKGISVENPNNQ